MEANSMNSNVLYKYMIRTERNALNAQDMLLNRIKGFIGKFIKEDVSDYTRIVLAEGGYIKIRTVEKIEKEHLDEFMKEFDFELCWESEDTMTDYRNVETVSTTIYEYAFIPTDINKILGDNQVDFNVDSD